jgi:menaquinone-dependent protoporphyrinogen oxidase
MRAAIFFATREGQARRVAEYIADVLHERSVAADIFDVADLRHSFDWSPYQTACVVASVHAGKHEKEMIRFVRRHKSELERVSASFVSLTLSQAGAQDERRPPEDRRAAAADVQMMIDVFVRDTGWQPAQALPLAGALAYRKYNPLIRFVMKRIARKQGAPTDTSRNYEFTDWRAVDRFVDDVIAPVPRRCCDSGDRQRAS